MKYQIEIADELAEKYERIAASEGRTALEYMQLALQCYVAEQEEPREVWQSLGTLDLGGQFDQLNIRDLVYEK